MNQILALAIVAITGLGFAADSPKPVEITLEDQFGAKQDLKPHRGKVVVLVYGDRRANEACKALGESLHVAFHPTAKGLTPEKARLAPVAPLPNLPTGIASPEVFVVPVACTGKVPSLVKSVLQNQIKKASPEIPVWLDCDDTMVNTFGLTTGEPNLVVIDAAGRARHITNGKKEPAAMQQVAQIIQDLRAETVRK